VSAESAGAAGRPAADLLIADAGLVLTCLPAGGDPIGRILQGSVAVGGERILAVGPAAEVAARVDLSAARVLDARGKIVAPGFVDCHTHLVFGGSRVQEYAARLTRSAAEVAALGIPSGIQATVAATRAATEDELLASAARRLDGMFRHGTTTVESKSGYGLSPEAELRMLRANRRLAACQPVDVVSTFLGAHDFPPGVPRDRYLDQLVEEMIPAVAAERLAEFCDVYCDAGYYSAAEARRILEAGQAAGLRPKLHADAYSAAGAAALAAELAAVSADHLNYATEDDLRRLAAAGVAAVVMPALDWAVGHARPSNARAMLSAGTPLALATDLCPACWVESMQFVMQLACRLYHLTPEEALYAATAGAARALGLADRGTLAHGQLADLQIWHLPTFEDVVYRLGHNAVETVVKRGQVYI
jgi:imidazolonepropionase